MIKPVSEVMILYPDIDSEQRDESVRFISLVPDQNSMLREYLSKAFEAIYED